jgi:hypothetical protein
MLNSSKIKSHRYVYILKYISLLRSGSAVRLIANIYVHDTSHQRRRSDTPIGIDLGI